MDHGQYLAHWKMTLFFEALINDLDTARRMIEDGTVDVNTPYNYQTALKYAMGWEKPHAVLLLLQHGAKPTWKGSLNDALFKLGKTEQSYDIVRLLLEQGADCNQKDDCDSSRPLFHALRRANSKCVKLLLDHGADISVTDGSGRTVLRDALEVASLECIKLVLDHGGDFKALDRHGKTALHYAAWNPHVDVIQFAVDRFGFHIDCSDDRGWSALHTAVSYNNLGACELLLRNGAGVNKETMWGYTPLACLRKNAPESLVQLLVEYGADVTRSVHGKTILEITMSKNSSVAEYLIPHMAKLECLNLSINEHDRKIIKRGPCYEKYFEKCLRELQAMKLAKFYNNVSVFDICTGSGRVTSGFSKNEELVETLEERTYGERFPIYFTRSVKNFYVEAKKQKLRKSAATTLCHLFKFNDLSHIVNQKIISYLREADLNFLEL